MQYLTIIVPIAPEDVAYTERQFNTRVLYNAYLPFKYSYITDSHVFPCFNESYPKLFSQFSQSQVDISASNREGDRIAISGGAILSKWGVNSHLFWLEQFRKLSTGYKGSDDQSVMMITLLHDQNQVWKFRWLSSNWFWATMGINEKGFFFGASRCYRSSIISTGPIMWIHGSPSECQLMNGLHNEFISKKRVYFIRGDCNTTKRGPSVVTSHEELRQYVFPYQPTHLNWTIDRDSSSLFWD